MIFGPTREHPPAHVHVFKGHHSEVVIRLGDPDQRPTLRETRGLGPRDTARALRLVREHADFLRERWRDLHGQA